VPTVKGRRETLERLARAIGDRQEAILEALDRDLGKPRVEAYVAEYHFVLAEIREATRRLGSWARPRRVRNPFFYLPARSEIRREPHGRVLVISPWNYPFQLAVSPLIPAVAAGNRVVLKPSECAPATAALLAELVAEVFDPARVTVARGGAEVAARLLDEEFDFYFFTGGGRVGRLVAEAAARRPAPCVLELGGKSPCLVAPDADFEAAADRIAAGKFFNAGQTCMAPDFVLVPEERREEFVARLEVLLGKWYGKGSKNDLARIVNREHLDRLLSLAGAGARVVGEDDPAENRLAPRLVPDAGWDHPAMQEEIFGPVLPVLGYGDWEEMLARAGALPPALALYVFSRSRGRFEEAAGAIRSGSVCFNDTMKQAANPALPFGGVGASGYGRYRGRAGFEAFSYPRAVTRRFFLPDLFALRPPYRGRLERLRRILK